MEETITLDESPDGRIKKGDIILTTAQSAGHSEYVKNKISGTFLLVGKVYQCVEKTYYDGDENVTLCKESYLDLRFPPIKLFDGSHKSSNRCGLTPLGECFKIVAADDPNLNNLDLGTRVNVHEGYRFVYGRWMMKYLFN